MSFFRDSEEIFIHSWSYATKSTILIYQTYEDFTRNYLIRDRLDVIKERLSFYEIIGYATSFMLDKLRDDIESFHGWTDDSYNLNLRYQVMLAGAFEEVFEIKNHSIDFTKILLPYYSGLDYVIDDIDEKWHLHDNEGNYIRENAYAYRLSLIYQNVNQSIASKITRENYSDAGLVYYPESFINPDFKLLKSNLKKLLNEGVPKMFK